MSVSNGSFPSCPCYNGLQTEWTIAEFDLSAYSGFTKLRFRFGSDNGTQLTGWFIDDITITEIASEVETENKPFQVKGFTLGGCYPNPFNSSTAINFNIPEKGEAILSVYNTLGRLIYQSEQYYSREGRHLWIWNAKTSASGLYFYKVEFNDQVQTGKCLLLK